MRPVVTGGGVARSLRVRVPVAGLRLEVRRRTRATRFTRRWMLGVTNCLCVVQARSRTRASGRAAAGSSQKDPRDALYTEVDARCDKLSVCLCVCVWCRREALRVPVAGLRLEVRRRTRATRFTRRWMLGVTNCLCVCVCVWFRREALRVPVAGLRLEVRAVGRADAARPQTHRRPAVHVPGLRTRILAIRPPRAARQATLRPVNTRRRRRRRRPRTSYAAAATGDRPLRAVQGPDLQNILRFSIRLS